MLGLEADLGPRRGAAREALGVPVSPEGRRSAGAARPRSVTREALGGWA
jgi:hypothetical protein